jgi:streptomycin 6-kinase
MAMIDPQQGRLEDIVRQWDLTLDGDPVRTLAGTVCHVRVADQPAVLKVTAEPEEQQGIRLLRWAAGRAGLVPVLRADTDAILMPRLNDEPSLVTLAVENDDEAVSILVRSLGRIHRELAPDDSLNLTGLDRWFDALIKADELPQPLLVAGREVAVRLLRSQHDISLLHGDFHHGNLLQNRVGDWTAIDPKGLVGERTFDFVNLLRNPEGHLELAASRFHQRIRQIAREANIPPRRLLEWTFAFCSLSAVWLLDDGAEPVADLRIARLAADALGIEV